MKLQKSKLSPPADDAYIPSAVTIQYSAKLFYAKRICTDRGDVYNNDYSVEITQCKIYRPSTMVRDLLLIMCAFSEAKLRTTFSLWDIMAMRAFSRMLKKSAKSICKYIFHMMFYSAGHFFIYFYL